MMEKVNAVIHLEVPKWQVGNNVMVYFPDTMTLKAICESEEEYNSKVQNIRKVTNICLCGECPSCGKRVFTSTNPNFCGHCGDRLTWKDGKHE